MLFAEMVWVEILCGLKLLWIKTGDPFIQCTVLANKRKQLEHYLKR